MEALHDLLKAMEVLDDLLKAEGVIRNLMTALQQLMDAVDNMPAESEEVWPNEWANACTALDDAANFLER